MALCHWVHLRRVSVWAVPLLSIALLASTVLARCTIGEQRWRMPLPIRAKALSLSYIVIQVLLFLLLMGYLPSEQAFPPVGPWPFFFVMALICLVFVAYMLPETAGKSLDEITLLVAQQQAQRVICPPARPR